MVCRGVGTMMAAKRVALGISAVLLCMSCDAKDAGGRGTAPAPIARAVESERSQQVVDEAPAKVLEGTDVVALASLRLRPLDASAAGAYRADQGGAESRLKISVGGGSWTVERIFQEPGEPPDRATYRVSLRDGVLSSPDGSVLLRGTEAGVLVFERDSDYVSPMYWVHYLRAK